jgi:serine/threonine protein kinase
MARSPLNSKSPLTATQIALSPNFAEFIRWEAVMLTTSKHRLIVELLEMTSNTWDRNSTIATEFTGNWRRVNVLTLTNCAWTSGNRIACIPVGIALATRFLHSCRLIHGDVKLDNMLWNWDWNLRPDDVGQGISLTNSGIPSLTHVEAMHAMLFADSQDLAPECSDNRNS